MQNLQNLIPAKSGYELGGGVAINDNGQIAATTTTPTNPTTTGGHALLLTPTDHPAHPASEPWGAPRKVRPAHR